MFCLAMSEMQSLIVANGVFLESTLVASGLQNCHPSKTASISLPFPEWHSHNFASVFSFDFILYGAMHFVHCCNPQFILTLKFSMQDIHCFWQKLYIALAFQMGHVTCQIIAFCIHLFCPWLKWQFNPLLQFSFQTISAVLARLRMHWLTQRIKKEMLSTMQFVTKLAMMVFEFVKCMPLIELWFVGINSLDSLAHDAAAHHHFFLSYWLLHVSSERLDFCQTFLSAGNWLQLLWFWQFLPFCSCVGGFWSWLLENFVHK